MTTRPEIVARFFDAAGSDVLSLVVSTYHSAGKVARALQLTYVTRRLDLVVADEAHRLAGRVEPRFAVALRDTHVPARQRLFQTATPIQLGHLAGSGVNALSLPVPILDMNDSAVFGPVVYNLPTGEAIRRGLFATIAWSSPHLNVILWLRLGWRR